MKSFTWTVASFAALAFANINEENSIVRLQTQTAWEQAKYDDINKAFTYTDLGSATVELCGQSSFVEDEGKQYLKLEFRFLNYDISADKVVEFQLRFQTERASVVDPVQLMYYDAVSCQMQQNSQDTRFWTQTANDGHIKCADYTCSAVDDSGTWVDDPSSGGIDWTTPDLDEDPANPFCTPHSTDPDEYACEAIKCIVQRAFDTNDAYDFKFRPEENPGTNADPTKVDKINIKQYQMSIGLHDIDPTTGEANTSDSVYHKNSNVQTFTLNIWMGSLSGLGCGIAATALGLSALAL